MAWDADGTVFLQSRDLTGYQMYEDASGVAAAGYNNEDDALNPDNFLDAFDPNPHYLIFPELREVDGIFSRFVRGGTEYTTEIAGSPDGVGGAATTNGRDGTWQTLIADYAATDTDVDPSYRSNIATMAAANIRAIRIIKQANWEYAKAIHVYGEISPGQTPDRLLFIDEGTGLEFTASVDWEDDPRGMSADKTFRLKNNSTVAGNNLTANNVQYTAEHLYRNAGDFFTFTLPGGSTFQGTQQVTSIAPETTTGLITARCIIPGTEVPALRAGRYRVSVATWS